MEAGTYLRFALALVLVLGLIFALSWVLRRFGLVDGASAVVGRKRRLKAIESAALDSRHRVVLVRRDAVEHLLLVGPNTSQVIETGIVAPAEDASAAEPSPLSAFARLLSKERQP